MQDNNLKRIGVISDTHGLFRQAVKDAFQGVEAIFHAGDVGDMDVLNELERMAPVYAVRGNMDRGDLFEDLPDTLLRDCCGKSIYMLHDLLRLNVNPLVMGVNVVIHGHTHQASVEERSGVLYLNPGCAGRNPKHGRASVCVIEVLGTSIKPNVVQI